MKKILFVLCFIILFLGCKQKNNNNNNEINNLNNTDEISETFVFEINDLNGTWLPDWNCRVGEGYKLVDIEFSWGLGQSAVYSSFDIDITADKPFIHPPGIRPFLITKIIPSGKNSLILHANYSYEEPPEEEAYFEIIINFIDKNTITIKTDIETTLIEGDKRINPYDGNEIWHRL